jgi:Tfp pilus assembly protein PilF
MAPNLKRRKRILVIAGVAAVGLAVAGGAYSLRQMRLDDEAKQNRIDGIAALERKDYSAALDGIGRYLQRWADREATSQDYVLYARARRNVELPNGKHLVGAIAHLRRALSIDPGNKEARSDLFEAHCAAGQATEAIEVLESMLAASPNDTELLRTKADLLGGRRQWKRALDAAYRLNELLPDDLADHARTLRLLLLSEAPTKQIDEWLARVAASHANDRRFDVLNAISYARRRDFESAKQELDKVLGASTEVTDPDFLALLVAELDSAGRFAEAMRVLERPGTDADPELRSECVRRLWFARRMQDLATRTSGWSAEQFEKNPEIDALNAVALTAVGRGADAEASIGRLAAHRDAAGKGWSAFVEWSVGRTKASRAVETAIAEAVAATPSSAILWQALGDVRVDIGDPELAFEAWTRATEQARSWARPLQRIADAFIAKGQAHLAPTYARSAVERARNDPEVVETYLRTFAAVANEMDRGELTGLLASMREFMEKVPHRAEEMLPSYVNVLGRVDKPAAEKRLAEVLAAEKAPGESTLLRLAGVAAANGLPTADGLLDLSEKTHGVSPQLALARALSAARASGDAAALAAFDDARKRAASPGDPLEWDLVRTPLLERVGHRDAGPAWIRLSETHPDVLRVQLGALASTAAWSDREAVARVIERVRAITGDEGVTWRLARARWVLSGPSVSPADLAETATALDRVVREAPRSTTARLLLAQAFERLGNLASAEEQLRLASDLAPSNSWIALQIARLAQSQGRSEEALRYLDRALGAGDLAADQVEQAAFLLAMQGDARRGAELLDKSNANSKPRREGRLLLAQIYANLGEYEKALASAEKLLPAADAVVIELVAGLYAQLGRPADAEAALARLDSIDAKPGERELVRARHAGRWGRAAAAGDWSKKAVDAAPQSAAAWRALLGDAVASGDAAKLAAVLDDPRGRDVDLLRSVGEQRALCLAALSDKRTQSLLVAALDDPANRAVLFEAIKILSDGWTDLGKRAAIAQRLRALADGNVRVLTLQIVAADACAEAGDLRNAFEIAKRTTTQFSDSVIAAGLWAQLLATGSRWEEALVAATAWKSRSVGGGADADVLIADALLHLGRPADAASGLEPLVPAALKQPAGNEPLLIAYALACTRSGRASRGEKILTELAAAHEAWGTVPLTVDAERLGDAASATAWLRTCGRLAPSTPETQLTLARAWGGAWERYRSPELLAGARKVIAEIVASPAAGADVHFLSATLSLQNGEIDAARSGYAEALKRDPNLHEARNNLAYLLTDAGQVKEAVEEAKKAVAGAPKNANYRDTLARALRRAREFEEARKVLNEAVLLEPTNPEWRANLAETLVEGGHVAEARRELLRFDELVAAGAKPPADAPARMEKLRSSLR